jgi:hypothetical protein
MGLDGGDLFPVGRAKRPVQAYRGGMHHEVTPSIDPIYSAGDILVSPADGAYQVSRVSADGRSSHVLGFQKTQPAALHMAARATSGYQRVFLRHEPGVSEYRLVESAG